MSGVQYEPDLGERRSVNFEKGTARVQILLRAGDDPGREAVRAHLRQGIGNLILRKPEDPLEEPALSDRKAVTAARRGDVLPPASGREIGIYRVRPGDSLWQIARRFGMQTPVLAALNGLNLDDVLPAGRPLKVMVYTSHDLSLDANPAKRSRDPFLLDQIRMADGRSVTPDRVPDFGSEVLADHPPEAKKVIGADGIERLAVSVEFNLIPDHLKVRARKYYPLVLQHANRHQLNPALIMAIIHTESVFNPRARSETPAYGLMQLVPHGGALEAYRAIYGERRRLTPRYLYDPQHNIELGAAYFNILKNNYMGDIEDPTSRTYCAVAAYNAGASNVGSAFIARKSINQATPKINRLAPPEVYRRLVEALPYEESRNYVRKVLQRADLYRKWR